jgi:hypothetical protein
MATARAAVAGMLVALLFVWAQNPQDDEFTQPEVVVLVVLLAVIALLIVPDAAHQFRVMRGKHDREDE